MQNPPAQKGRQYKAVPFLVLLLFIEALLFLFVRKVAEYVPNRGFAVLAFFLILLNATVGACLRRYVPLRWWNIAWLTYVVLLLLWKVPTPGTAFFTQADRVHPGMTVREVRVCLSQYRLALNDRDILDCQTLYGLGVSDAQAAVTRNGIPSDFTGFIVCNDPLMSTNVVVYEIKTGIVKRVRHWVDKCAVD